MGGGSAGTSGVEAPQDMSTTTTDIVWRQRLARYYHSLPKPRRLLLNLATALVIALFLGLFAGTGLITVGLPDVAGLDKYDPSAGTKIYAADGTLIANVIDESRSYVPYSSISPTMVNAMVAVEDRRFFAHGGVDLRGVARAIVGNLGAGEVEQGGSTLTMQLARRLFLTDERTYSRKVKEAVLAYRIDRGLSKEKILELYLNEVYFGAGAYGVGAASELYFAKKPADLKLAEAALLAGLVQAPSLLNPLHDRAAALKRMNEVLEAMRQAGQITEQEMLEARNAAALFRFKDRKVHQRDALLKHPYFVSFVMQELERQFPERNLQRGGLQVVTSMDVGMQIAAERALSESLSGGAGAMGADRGAIVALDNRTGEIVAMAGGLEWSQRDQFNPAWQARRQPGSTFKPFVYAAALEEGFNPEQEFADTETTFAPASDPWTPHNSDHGYMGAIPMRTGLQHSRNVVAAKVIAHVGPERVIQLVRQMGLDSDLPNYASLALGAGEVTPLQMARAYSTFPNGGLLRPAGVVRKITSSDGRILMETSEEVPETRVMSEDTARLMCEMLKRVVDRGTGTAAALPGTFVAGKTGTTDNFADAWFVGFTPRHTVSAWLGRDDNQPMDAMFGGGYPAEMFARVAKIGVGDEPSLELPGVSFQGPVEATLCEDSTYVALPGCPRTYVEVFQAGVMATRECPMHRTAGMANPRFDPEVVDSMGAKLGYTEEVPTYAQGIPEERLAIPSASATPHEVRTAPGTVQATPYSPPAMGSVPRLEEPHPDDVSALGATPSVSTVPSSAPEDAWPQEGQSSFESATPSEPVEPEWEAPYEAPPAPSYQAPPADPEAAPVDDPLYPPAPGPQPAPPPESMP